jgi:hypothetical protein
MKNLRVGAELVNTNGRTDRHENNSRFLQFFKGA